MLQQTQTSRVEKKFVEFIELFPDFKTLAQAERVDVLAAWVGLGYNRRGVALHEIAKRVIAEFNGKLPDDVETLKTFKGLGPATASSVVAFAFNRPTVFIETNIRAVYLHCFYPKEQEVHDNMLMPLVEMTVDKASPRQWYYALMDYGVYLKKQFKNPSRKSKHHTTQSQFEGSDRQIRGAIIKLLTQKKELSEKQLLEQLQFEAARIQEQCKKLLAEKMIFKKDDRISF
jgi:A/G-specific adenine glycosylase